MLTLGIDKAHTYILQVLDELKGMEDTGLQYGEYVARVEGKK